MAESKSSPKHVAVLTFPFTSHVALLISLTRRLSKAAPDLKFSFFSTAESNNSHFAKDDGEFSNIKPYNVDAGLPEGYVTNDEGPPQVAVEYFMKATPGNFQRAIQTAEAEAGRKICCLITDAFLWFAAEMAKDMQVHWIPYWISGPRSLLVHLETENIRQRLGINGPGEQTLEFIPGFSTMRAMDLPKGVVSGPLDDGIAVLLNKMGQMLPQATAVALNSFEELDLPVVGALKSRLPKLLSVGPFTLTSPPPAYSDKHGCLEWLEKREKSSVAYISFGSTIQPSPPELTALAEALEASKTPFLWSFRGNPEKRLPQGFLQRTSAYGKVVPWAPQIKILEHSSVGVFVTHCGWNSAIESITGCVPMICRPFFGEQGVNQRTIETVWGIGLGVDDGKFTKDGTMKALRTILTTEQGKIMREKIGVFKQLAIKAVESDGSSTENFKALLDIITSEN